MEIEHMSTTTNIRHDLLNSVVIIKRLITSLKPTIEKMVDDCLTHKLTTEYTDKQLETLKQSMIILEKEAEKLSRICDNI